MSGHKRLLPDVPVLLQELSAPGATLEKVGSRYGVSRQAVHKAIDKHKKKADPELVAAVSS